jgi:hypothetical protein
MGLLIAQTEWLANQLVKNEICGSVLQIGKIDFFVSQEELEIIMVKVGAARRVDGAIVISNPTAKLLYEQTIMDGHHFNETFDNVRFTKKKIISSELFFSAFGFKIISSVDIDKSRDNSTYEYNLNQPGLLASINKQFDLVIDGGTLEHIFDVRTALLNTSDVARVDGFIIQILPGNNTFDHGFFQFSPTLFKDWYEANKYLVHAIHIMELRSNVYSMPDASFDERFDTHRFFEYDPWLMAKCSFGKLHDGVYINFVCVQKLETSLRDIAPHQYIFTKNAKYISPWKE